MVSINKNIPYLHYKSFIVYGFQMVRTYERKGPGTKWRDEDMDRAISSVLKGDLSIRGAAGIFSVPFSTLKDRINIIKRQNALGEEATIRSVGHPTVFSFIQEKELAERLKCLAGRGFGCTPEQIRRAAFQYANKMNIDHPWNAQEMMAGKDWFTNFLKRNKDISLRKPQSLSKARAEGMSKKAVEDFFCLLKDVYVNTNISDKPHLIFNMDESGIPLNNSPSKIVAPKGAREIVKLSSVERGENVTIVTCCSATGVFIPPFVIFKGARFRDVYKSDMPTGSEVVMTDSGYINEDVFLEWLHHFQKNRPTGRCLLILDGHTSHSSLKSLDYCRENEIEMISLPPHTTHALQPLDRAVFKPLKSFYHKQATNFIQSSPNSSISKFNFGKLFSEAWRKGATIGNAVKGFECTGIYPFNPSAIPEHKFLPQNYFQSVEEASGVSLRSAESHASNSLSSSSPSSTQPESSKITEGSEDGVKTSPFAIVLPSPEKQQGKKHRKRSTTKHLTSNDNYEEVAAKRRLKMETESNRSDKEINNKEPTSDEEEIRQVTAQSDENIPCGFCNLKYLSPKSVLKGDWIQCQKCGTWYHAVCVGAERKKMFTCGRCM